MALDAVGGTLAARMSSALAEVMLNHILPLSAASMRLPFAVIKAAAPGLLTPFSGAVAGWLHGLLREYVRQGAGVAVAILGIQRTKGALFHSISVLMIFTSIPATGPPMYMKMRLIAVLCGRWLVST